MKKFLPTLIAAAALVTIAFPGNILFANDKSENTPPGKITFVAKNKLVTARGIFNQWKFTTAKFDPENLDESVIEIEVDIASVDTAITRRDNHLREEEFFHTEAFPTATLKIDKFEKLGEDEDGKPLYKGMLAFTLRGVQKIYDNFKFSITNEHPIQVMGTFQVLRTDFKVGKSYSKLNPLSVKDEIQIAFEAKLPV